MRTKEDKPQRHKGHREQEEKGFFSCSLLCALCASVVWILFSLYNGVRLHSAIGYVTLNELLAGRAKAIWAERDRKLEVAREILRLHDRGRSRTCESGGCNEKAVVDGSAAVAELGSRTSVENRVRATLGHRQVLHHSVDHRRTVMMS
ncbi:uncharacterized protein SOCE836_003020 [Sorangium cellulosum]|uniref:Uncharacterized protein n=1 Tax=Sorangium cellulosum TaxID=56 RepID=A0A4P2QEI7_SORCE|nr:uncharacterized protein SOCE836_003020 [Sorangium cellulosum]